MAEGYREEAFAGLLNPLKEMPCSTPEERKQRLDDFRKHPLHDRLIMELLQALKPEAYKSLLNPQPDRARAASAIASASTSPERKLILRSSWRQSMKQFSDIPEGRKTKQSIPLSAV